MQKKKIANIPMNDRGTDFLTPGRLPKTLEKHFRNHFSMGLGGSQLANGITQKDQGFHFESSDFMLISILLFAFLCLYGDKSGPHASDLWLDFFLDKCYRF
jgi:hypothetical protein